MKFVAAACTAVLSSTTYAAAQEECGTVSVAEMNWASAGLAAWVDKVILEEGYDCTVSLVAGGLGVGALAIGLGLTLRRRRARH